MIGPDAIRLARNSLGRELAAFRDAAQLTQQQLAGSIIYGRSTVASAETGHAECSQEFWERCDTALAARGALLDSYEHVRNLKREHAKATAESRASQGVGEQLIGEVESWSASIAADTVDDVRRRTVVGLAALPWLAAAAPLGDPWERLARASEHPQALDPLTLDYIEDTTHQLFRLEEHLPSRRVADHLSGHLRMLRGLAADCPENLRIRVLRTTGEALALAGWLAWDSQRPQQANSLYREAEAAARQAGDGPLLACVFAYRSYAAEATNDLSTAHDLLTAAQTLVRDQHSAGTRSWLAAREAETCASLADSSGALRALDRAITAYDYARPGERSWTGFFTGARLGSMTVTTYARLRHPDLDQTAGAVVSALPAVEAKTGAVIFADVALAAIQRQQHDRGAELARRALAATVVHEASLGRQRLAHLHHVIRPQRSISVLADLDDALTAQLG